MDAFSLSAQDKPSQSPPSFVSDSTQQNATAFPAFQDVFQAVLKQRGQVALEQDVLGTPNTALPEKTALPQLSELEGVAFKAELPDQSLEPELKKFLSEELGLTASALEMEIPVISQGQVIAMVQGVLLWELKRFSVGSSQRLFKFRTDIDEEWSLSISVLEEKGALQLQLSATESLASLLSEPETMDALLAHLDKGGYKVSSLHINADQGSGEDV